MPLPEFTPALCIRSHRAPHVRRLVGYSCASPSAFTLLETLAAIILIAICSTLLLGSMLSPRATDSAPSTVHALVSLDHNARLLARTTGPVRLTQTDSRLVAMATDSGRVLLEHPLGADTRLVISIHGEPHDQYLIDANGRSADIVIRASQGGTFGAATISGLTGWTTYRSSHRYGTGGAE